MGPEAGATDQRMILGSHPVMMSLSFAVSIRGNRGSKAANGEVLGCREVEAKVPWRSGRGEESPHWKIHPFLRSGES